MTVAVPSKTPGLLVVSDAVWMALITACAAVLTLLLRMAFSLYVAHRREKAATDEQKEAWDIDVGDLDDKPKGRRK